MTSDYRPVGCGLYDRFEVLAGHAEPIELEAGGPAGEARRLSGRARDLRVRDGAEYLVVEDDAGERHELRLDRLHWIRRKGDGRVWRQGSVDFE